MRACRRRLLGAAAQGVTVHRDTTKLPRISTEVGVWHYTAPVMHAFQAWCRARGVRAYHAVRITRTAHFARCLRATRVLRPGEGIVTCPAPACYNFLTVAREMSECNSSATTTRTTSTSTASSTTTTTFPLELNWMNYNERLPYLRSMCTYELAMPGWMARTAARSRDDYVNDADTNKAAATAATTTTGQRDECGSGSGNSGNSDVVSSAAPYIHYLLQDTRGRDGIATGISRERQEDSSRLEHVLSEMAADAGDEPEEFLEHLLRAMACLHMRTQPIEAAAVLTYMPGTNFFKAKVGEMYVPTLMPLIDTVAQVEDGTHNCVVEYVPFRDVSTLRRQYAELCVNLSTYAHHDAPAATAAATATAATTARADAAAAATRVEDALLEEDAALLRGSGFFVLRALQPIEPGDVLYLRRYPQENNGAKERMRAQVNEASRLLAHDN